MYIYRYTNIYIYIYIHIYASLPKQQASNHMVVHHPGRQHVAWSASLWVTQINMGGVIWDIIPDTPTLECFYSK